MSTRAPNPTAYGKRQQQIAEADQKAVEAQMAGNQAAFAEWRTIGDVLRQREGR